MFYAYCLARFMIFFINLPNNGYCVSIKEKRKLKNK